MWRGLRSKRIWKFYFFLSHAKESVVKLSLIVSLVMFISCKEQYADTAMHIVIDTTPVIWMYGLPDADEIAARNAVARKYGFHFEHKFGCVVTRKIRHSIHMHNQAVNTQLDAQLGYGWEDKFYDQVEIMKEILHNLNELLQHNKALEEKNRSIGKTESIYYELLPTSSRNYIVISACETKELDRKLYKYEYYKALIDGKGGIRFSK